MRLMGCVVECRHRSRICMAVVFNAVRAIESKSLICKHADAIVSFHSEDFVLELDKERMEVTGLATSCSRSSTMDIISTTSGQKAVVKCTIIITVLRVID
jgi:hypothetical protein